MTWQTRVIEYVDQLNECISEIGEVVEKTRVDTVAGEYENVTPHSRSIVDRLAELEQLIAVRENLLSDPDAPMTGDTLLAKMESIAELENAESIDYIKQVEQKITDIHPRAVSLFVCQYHLADFGDELTRILSGDEGSKTYGDQPATRQKGGGLFNESA